MSNDLSSYEDYETYVDPTYVWIAAHNHAPFVLVILALVILGYIWETR